MVSETKHWYAVLTRINTEYKVKEYLDKQGVENFLPLQPRTIERNGKRTEKLALVLPRMLFVHITPSQFFEVRNTMNVYSFVHDRSRNTPSVIPDNQMVDFRYMVDYSKKQIVITNEDIPEGAPVVVAKGDLQGLRGELVRYNGKYQIMVRVNMLGNAMVSIPASYVKKDKVRRKASSAV